MSRVDSLIENSFDSVPGASYSDKLNFLSNCNCCERHQINKPTLFAPWYETPFSNNNTTHTCTCNCRHIARFICRQADDYTPPIIRTNTPNSIIDF